MGLLGLLMDTFLEHFAFPRLVYYPVPVVDSCVFLFVCVSINVMKYSSRVCLL